MQILELLGSTASTIKVPQADLTSQKDAFAKHLDEVLSQRDEMRSEDAHLHSSRQEERSDVRPDQEDNVDDVERAERPEADDEEEISATSTNKDDTGKTEEASSQSDGQGATEVAAPAIEVDLTETLIAGTSGEDTVVGKAADDQLQTVVAVETAEVVTEEVSGIVAALDAAHRANPDAAFKDNNNASASDVVSNNAGPFTQAAGTGGNSQDVEQTATLIVTPEDTGEVALENTGFAAELAAKADMSDLSDDVQVVSQVAAGNNVQQARTTPVENKARNEAKAEAGQVVAESPLIKDTQIEVGPDPRLTEMKIAQALVEEAAAEKIHAQFMVGAGTANNATVLNQVAAAQSSGATEAGIQASQSRPPAQPQTKPIPQALSMAQGEEVQPQGDRLAARVEVAPPAPSEIARPVPGQNGLANMNPTGFTNMSERAATTLAQMTADAAQGQNATKPSQAALPSAAAGAEIASNAMSGSSSTAPATAIGEVGGPNNTQMANAAKPAAPPPPSTPQPPQVQVAMHIAKAVQNGTNKISIKLNPQELGRVDIKLEVARDGAVTASVTVERPETLELLKGDARSLERALASAGLNPDSDDLTFNLRDPNSGSGFARNADGDGNKPGNGGDGSDLANAEDEEVDVEALLAEARASASHDRALDINV